jgi:hypothetical protein
MLQISGEQFAWQQSPKATRVHKISAGKILSQRDSKSSKGAFNQTPARI